MDLKLHHSVEQFLYREARLLDQRRFRDWFELFTDDCRYWMPTRRNRLRDGAEESWGVDDELEDEHGLGLFDDNKTSLGMRVRRLYTGMAWTEDPPSRTRHLIGNVEVQPAPTDGGHAGEVLALSSFMLFRSRNEGLEGDEDVFTGAREDILRRDGDDDGDGDWRIARRRIIPDFVTINAHNLSMFF